MSNNKPNRNARMVGKQKEELLRLLQVYFIRNVGRAVNVNGINIDKGSWKIFAERLNEYGPPKHVDDWEKSLYYMKLRIKAKKEQMIKRSNERGEKLILSDFNEIDQKMVQMFYPENVLTDEQTWINLENENGSTITQTGIKIENSNQLYLNESDNVWCVMPKSNEMLAEFINENQPLLVNKNDSIITQTGSNIENSNQNSLNKSDYVWSVMPEVNETEAETMNENGFRVTRVVSLYNPEITSELTEYIGPPENIQSAEQEPASSCVPSVQQAEENEMDVEAQTMNENGLHVTRVVSQYNPEITSELTEFIGPPKDIQSAEQMSVSTCQSVQRELTDITEPTLNRSEKQAASRRHLVKPGSSKRPVARRERSIRCAPRSGVRVRKRILVKSSRVNRVRVVRKRISEIQKRTLLDLVEQNFLRTVGRYSGFNGVVIKRRLWESYAKELNALGPPSRTPKGWKTVFTNIRLSTKSKIAKIRHVRSQIGGKNKVAVRLTAMDEQIVSMYGIDLLDGHQKLSEGGFPDKKTLPYYNPSSASTGMNRNTPSEMTEINDVRGFFDDNGDESDAEFDSHPVAAALSDVSRNVNILSNEIIPPSQNLLAKLRKESQQERGRGQLFRQNSSSEGVMEQGQSSRDTSINMPLSQFNLLKQQSSYTQGQSYRGTSINIPLSLAKIKPNLINHRSQSSVTQSNFRSAAQRGPIRQESSDNESVNVSEPQAQAPHGNNTIRQEPSENESVDGSESQARTIRGHNTVRQGSAVSQSVNAPETQTRTTRGSGRGRGRGRNATNARAPVDNRNGNRHRNEHTSYGMVERAYEAQVQLNEQVVRNHNEMVYMFTLALKECASALRDHFNGNQ